MNSWKTNLLNLNSSLSFNLRNSQIKNIDNNSINTIQSLNNKNNEISIINKDLNLSKLNVAPQENNTNRYRALNRASNVLGLKWKTINKSNTILNNKNSLLSQNNKIEDIRSTLATINQNYFSFKELLTGVKTKNLIKFHYLNTCLNKTKLSLIKYKGRKNGNILNYNKIIGYNFINTNINSKSYLNISNNIIIKNTYKLLFYFFKSMYCLISKPVIKYTNDKVTIQLFYYLNIPKKKIFRLFSILYINSIKNKWLLNNINRDRRSKSSSLFIKWKVRKAISRFKNKNNKNLLFNLRKFDLTKVFFNKFKLICEILSNKFNKPVELQLTRLHHPYHDSNILVNLLALNILNKRKKANWAIKKVYSKNAIKDLNDPALTQVKNIPAFLSGLNIKIAGRLMREPIIPRITTKVFEKGASATGKVNYLDVASITRKNRKGAYTIKVTSGQNFF